MELDKDTAEWADILEEARQQESQWKARGDEARAQIVKAAVDTDDFLGTVNGELRYKVVKYTTKRFDRKEFQKDWAALDKAFTKETESYRVELIGDGREADDGA